MWSINETGLAHYRWAATHPEHGESLFATLAEATQFVEAHTAPATGQERAAHLQAYLRRNPVPSTAWAGPETLEIAERAAGAADELSGLTVEFQARLIERRVNDWGGEATVRDLVRIMHEMGWQPPR